MEHTSRRFTIHQNGYLAAETTMVEGERGVEIVKDLTKEIFWQLKKYTRILKLKEHTEFRTELLKRNIQTHLVEISKHQG